MKWILFICLIIALFCVYKTDEEATAVKIYLKYERVLDKVTFNEVREGQLKYLGITKWHEAGYKGKGITILNCESDADHGAKTRNIIELIAPEATIISQSISYSSLDSVSNWYIYDNNERIPLKEYITENSVDIISVSLVNNVNYDKEHIANLGEILTSTGCVLFNSAGNDGDEGIRSKFPFEHCISVGALYCSPDTYGVKYANYSSQGIEIDFSSTTFGYSGTSFSCPALASMTALLMQRDGKMDFVDTYATLMKLSKDIDDSGFDIKTGWGVPFMPDPNKQIIELYIGNEEYMHNGTIKEMDTAPFIKDSRTFVPIRFIAEVLDCDIEWDDKTKTVTIRRK